MITTEFQVPQVPAHDTPHRLGDVLLHDDQVPRAALVTLAGLDEDDEDLLASNGEDVTGSLRLLEGG